MPEQQRKNLLWLQSGGCGGCSLSLLCAESPDLLASLEALDINLLWHPLLSETSGQEVLELLNQIISGEISLDIFCVEGAVINGPNNSGRFHMLSGSGKPMRQWIENLAKVAGQVVAIGSCAAWGGVTAANENLVEACGLQYSGVQEGGLLGAAYRASSGRPVVNISGCPIHPNWVTENLALIAKDELVDESLDEFQRPRSYSDYLVHHGCPRNEFYEYKASAEKFPEQGCLMEHLGCLGTQARADCNIRLWNGEGSCLRGGFPCINCTAPEFETPSHAFVQTPKIAGIPVGLPTDMPKAWFVALASLAKAATPERLRHNAVSDMIHIPPGQAGRNKK